MQTAQYIVGPLLVTNSLNWALWGVLSTLLVFFVRDLRGRRRTSSTGVNAAASAAIEDGLFHNDQYFEKHPSAYQQDKAKSKFPFEFGFRTRIDNVRNSKSTFGNDDVNPWRKSFVPPTPAPLVVPSTTAHPSHARHRSGKSVPSSSDPCSPTAVHRSPLDTEAHSILLPSDSMMDLPSVYLLLALYAMYVFVCLRTVLGTAQFWRIGVDLWSVGTSGRHSRWMGIVLADCIGPLIFAMTMAYFIYALYFAPTINATTAKRRSRLRPLSLLKNKTSANLHPDPYSFPFPHSPTSTSNSHSLPPRPQPRRRPWRRFLTPNSVEPGLLALLATVVTVCGVIDCVRSLKERPLGEPLKLDAVSLIWFAGMVALDLVLCILLVRALEPWLRDVSWIARILRVMGESGGMQLVVALLALILMVSWRDGKPQSTLQVAAPSILPAIYAITVFLHASSTYGRLNAYARDLTTPSLRGPTKSVVSKFEDIEMGTRAAPRGAGTITPVPPTRVDLAAATAAGSTYSTTNDSSDGGAALRAQALAYGREREREREKEIYGARLHLERDTAGESSTNHLPNPSSFNANVVSVSGVSTTGNTGITETVTERAKAPSVRSGVSGALSLELPTFRKGRARGWRYGNGYGDPMMDEESGSDIGSDDWDEELDVDSMENGGTWDYGFANSEREKERERAAATLLAGAGISPDGGKGNGETMISVKGRAGPSRRWQKPTLSNKRSSYPSRPSSWRRSYPHPLSNSIVANSEGEGSEDDDKVSMLSGVSMRSKRRGRRSYYANSSLGCSNSQKRPPRLLPRTPGTLPLPPPLPISSIPPHLQNSASLPTPSAASISTESLYLTGNGNNGLTSPAGSVLVIGRGREPSIAEQSVDRAASVAATRASTGSLWSTFSDRWPWDGYGGGYVGGFGQAYPRPVKLPDLDFDLAEGKGTYANYGSGSGTTSGSAGGTGGGGTGDGSVNEQDLGEALAMGGLSHGGGVGRNDTRSPHPYSAAGMSMDAGVNGGNAEGEGEARGDGEERPAERRRWNVHPLKRIAEMGRLRF